MLISSCSDCSVCTNGMYTLSYINHQTGLSSSVVAGISVVITVPVTAIITAIITIIIMYLLCIKHNKQSWVPPSDYETPVEPSSTGLEMKSNTAYGQVIHTTDNSKPTPPAVYETVHTT